MHRINPSLRGPGGKSLSNLPLIWLVVIFGIAICLPDASARTKKHSISQPKLQLILGLDRKQSRQFSRAPKAWRQAMLTIKPASDQSTDLLRFYLRLNFTKAWSGNHRNTERAKAWQDLLKQAARYGLQPSEYAFIAPQIGEKIPINQWLADITATQAALSFIQHISSGRLKPSSINPQFDLPNPNTDKVEALIDIRQGNNVANAISRLEPRHKGYHRLKSVLAEIIDGQRADKLVRQPREQPFGSGQQRNSMRLSTAIVANLDRWRWLPRDLGDRHIWANLPEYSVALVEYGRTTFVSRAIIGKSLSRTPLISSHIKSIVMNPFWHLPASVVKSTVLPQLKSANAADYLAREKISVLRRGGRKLDPTKIDWSTISNPRAYRFRQSPGANNALGKVKISFPNSHSIFLHDTNEKSLFAQPNLAQSLGCLRLERPVAFADAIAKLDKKLESQMPGTLIGDQEHWLKYSHELPVHLTYFTVIPRQNGEIEILPDIYAYDRAMADRVKKPLPLKIEANF